MLRTTLVLLTQAMLVNVANAALYLGVGAGSDNIDFKQSAHVKRLMSFDVIDNTHLSGTGIFGSLFAGYVCRRDKWSIAAEINANLSSSAFSSSNAERLRGINANTQYKITDSYGISVLPGYLFNQATLVYLRLAYANARLKVQTSDSSLQNISQRRGGARYGLGIKQKLNQAWSLRADFSIADFKSTRMHTFDAISATTKDTTISPRQQLFELAMIYVFPSSTTSN